MDNQRDTVVEQILKKEKIPYHYEKDVPLTQINREASLKNQARYQAIKQEHVDDLIILAASGYALNALVGYRAKDGYIVLVNGNHRLEAYVQGNQTKQLNITKTDMYILEIANPDVIDRITRTINALNVVLPMTRDEKLEQAKILVLVQNMTHKEAADRLVIPEKSVTSALQAHNVRQRLAKYQFTNSLTPTTLSKMYRIKQDEALVAIASLAVDAKLSSDEVGEISKKVQEAAESASHQQKVINSLRDGCKERIAKIGKGKSRRQINPSIRLGRCIRAINSTRPESVIPIDSVMAKAAKRAISNLEKIISGS